MSHRPNRRGSQPWPATAENRKRRANVDQPRKRARIASSYDLRLLVAVVVLAVGSAAPAAERLPKSLDPRVEIRLFAESPQIVTPTDVAVDHRGRVWAIESNTHFRPAGYTRHASDRVLVFYDDDHDGKADRSETFADGFVYAMSIAVSFGEGVYVATRREVFHLADANGDGKADTRRVILTLDTPGDYPHNGLAGFAFDGLGYMYIGLGENQGAEYRLIGSDGRTLCGGGEGGSLFRCRLDGSDLTRWATGFWNPHASCVDGFGRMFTVDNDPDDRPPCRMLHIIPGAITVIVSATAAAASIRLRPGTASCPARCQWFRARARPLPESSRMSRTPWWGGIPRHPVGDVVGRSSNRPLPRPAAGDVVHLQGRAPYHRRRHFPPRGTGFVRRTAACLRPIGCYRTTKSTERDASGGSGQKRRKQDRRR